jgi:hypothetical protein
VVIVVPPHPPPVPPPAGTFVYPGINPVGARDQIVAVAVAMRRDIDPTPPAETTDRWEVAYNAGPLKRRRFGDTSRNPPAIIHDAPIASTQPGVPDYVPPDKGLAWRNPTAHESTGIAVLADEYRTFGAIRDAFADLLPRCNAHTSQPPDARLPPVMFSERPSSVLVVHEAKIADASIPVEIDHLQSTDPWSIETKLRGFVTTGRRSITFDVRTCGCDPAECKVFMRLVQGRVATIDGSRLFQTRESPKWIFLFVKEKTQRYHGEEEGTLNLDRERDVKRDVERALNDTEGTAIVALVVEGSLTGREPGIARRGLVSTYSRVGETLAFQYDGGLAGTDAAALARYLYAVEKQFLWPTDRAFASVQYK